MATRIITPAEHTRLENLARGLHKQGADTAKIAMITGLDDAEIAQAIATPEQTAAAAPSRPSPPQPQPARPPVARPVPAPPARPAVVAAVRPIESPRTEEPRAEDRTVEALLRRAEQATPQLCRKAERVRAFIADLWTAVGEHDAKTAAAREAEQDKERARIAVEEAKRALAQALAFAKEVGAKPGLKDTTSGSTPRTAGVGYSDERKAAMRAGHLRALHQKGKHEGRPFDGCTTCAEEAGGGSSRCRLSAAA